METREIILASALRMFNQQGYRQVSMRAIAEASGIAVGNVTYYFHQKADIVAALMESAYQEAKPEGPIRTLADVTDQFSRMLDALLRHAFYFLDEEFLHQPRQHNLAIRQRLLEGFSYLTAEGYFQPCFTADVQETVLNVLLLSHLSWLRNTLRLSEKWSKADFLDAHWTILLPYLSEKGHGCL